MNSSQSHEEQREVFSELKKGFAGLFYVAPERFAAIRSSAYCLN